MKIRRSGERLEDVLGQQTIRDIGAEGEMGWRTEVEEKEERVRIFDNKRGYCSRHFGTSEFRL